MDKTVRVNIESGIIHDLKSPCWWAENTKMDSVIDFYTIEEAVAEVANRRITPYGCELCKRKKGDKK